MRTLILVALTSFAAAFMTSDVDDDDHDHDHDHDGEYADCECITGFTTEDLEEECDDTETLIAIQDYLVENECNGYCHGHDGVAELHLDHGGDEEAGWHCFQVFSLLNQYHDYCPSGAINETLFHIYLDDCPDCAGQYHYDEDAPDCDTTLDCSDETAQLTAIKYVNSSCITSCEGNCTSVWQTVEGYHQICDHDDLSEEFDTIFDNLAFEETECGEDIHCNAPGSQDYTADCEDHANHDYEEYFDEYGKLELSVVTGDSGAVQFASGLGIMASLFVLLSQ